MFINKINGTMPMIGFKGYQHIKNDVGETIMKFNYPYDSENETCDIQIFRVEKTDKLNYKIDETPIATIPIKKDGTEVNLQRETDLDKDEAFAYKVIRKNKEGNIVWEGADTGNKVKPDDDEFVFRTMIGKDDFPKDSVSNYKYTLVKQNGTKPMVQGNGYLAMPDTFRPGIKYRGFNEEGTGEIYEDIEYQKKMEGMVKTFSNMYGGSMAGLEYLVPYLKKNGFKLLFTTPIANGDDRTSHGYWNKNNFQIAPNIGTTENYNSLMVKEFKNGIGHVFDATLSSEGIEGIHVQYNLRWGDQAPSYYWFRMDDLKDAPLGFGVIPQNAENLRHRVINAPFNYELQADGQYKRVENNDYNSKKETLFQIYDSSQVGIEQLKLDKPVRIYENIKSGKKLDINTHDDTVISYVFQINPNEYDKRIDVINELNKKFNKNIKLDSTDGTVLAARFSNFYLDKKTEGGYVAWDANTDMVKLNYGISAYDEKNHQAIKDKALRQHERDKRVRGGYEVQDMAVQTGIYWTEKTKNAHTLYAAQIIGDAKSTKKLDKLIDEGKLPEEVRISSSRFENILNGKYNLAPKGKLNKDDATVKALMKLPLDSLEFGENISAVLSMPYFSNRATTEDTIGVSRFDLMKNGNPHLVEPYKSLYNKTNEMFTNELNEFAQSVLAKVNENSNISLFNGDGNYTEYGEYVIELLGQDIAKYALLKSLAGESFKTKILPNGELTYDYDAIREAVTLKAIGINASNPTEEAQILYNKIIKGLHKLSDNDIEMVAKAINQRIKGTDTASFRLAEALVDISGLGLNFRLDAAKDVMDIDSVRNRDADFDDTWSQLIAFWAKYVQGVKSVNPYSYIVAEMTNVNEISADTFGAERACPYNGWTNVNNVKFNGEPDAMTKFFLETGITSEAAYAYFYTELLTAFSQNFEADGRTCSTHDEFKQKYDLLINTRSVDYLRNLYTFIGNHDKMRTIHGLAIDIPLYYSTLMYRGTDINNNRNHRLDVIKVMSGTENENDIPLELKLNLDNLDYFRTISSKAVAQSKLLMSSVVNDLKRKVSDEYIGLIKEAIIDLTNGNYLNSKETSKMTKMHIDELSSIDNAVNEVAKLAEKHGIILTETEIKNIVSKVNELDYKNYTVKGDFDWSEENSFADENINDLKKILGDNYGNAMDYSVYTVKIARMIQDAVEGTSQADVVNKALKDFVIKYNRKKISENMDSFKMFEAPVIQRKKNGYGARDFRVAMEEILDQAEYKSGTEIQNKEYIINTVYKSVTQPALQKHSMILSFLSALCGISTLYSGDELCDTGSEEKTKNVYLQNRNTSIWSEVDNPSSEIGAIKRNYQARTLSAMKYKAMIEPLRNGTPYSMDVKIDNMDRNGLYSKLYALQNERNNIPYDAPNRAELVKAKDKEIEAMQNKIANVAFMLQGADGKIAVSVLNAGGIYHGNRVNYFEKLEIQDKTKRNQFFEDNNINKASFNNPYVPIQEKSVIDAILLGAGISLPVGTVFVNANHSSRNGDKTEYIVSKLESGLGIIRKDGKKIILDGKTAKNGVMVLKNFGFKGRQSNPLCYHNQKFNFVSDPYVQNCNNKQGAKLYIMSK